MALCWSGLLLRLALLCICSTGINASINLSNELTNFVPVCAQTCFESFLENNFPTNTCTENPTLDCLCSHNSVSGYTVGEGAVQCIIAEVNVGFCKGVDAGNDVASNAFSMCTGRENAIPNTHRTITASVVVQTSMPSIVLIAPAATSISGSTGISDLSLTSSGAPTPFASLTTSTSNPAEASSTSTATSVEVAPGASKVTSSGVTKTQIIAIVVSSVGAVAIIAGIMGLVFFMKRRRQRSRDSDILPFQADPETPSIYGGFAKSSNKPWGKAPRVPGRLEISPPNMFSRRSIPNSIGLAISPERTIPMVINRSSRLLPEKPTLKINTNQPVVRASKQPPPALAMQDNRQSIMTEFEEEDGSADTTIDEYYGRESTDRIISQEASALKTIQVIQPGSRPSLHITNRYQQTQNNTNQIITTQELTTPPKSYSKAPPLDHGMGSFSRPRPGPDFVAPKSQFPTTTSQSMNSRPVTAGSSIYSSASNTPYTAAPSTGPLSSNPFPIPLSTRTQNQTHPQPQNQKSYRQKGPYDRISNSSFASFVSEDTSPERDQTRHTLMLDLSPVVESPLSGTSPVSYPKFETAGRLTQQTIRMVPPPTQPDFASVFSSGAGNFQLSNPPKQKPWDVAEIAAARQRRVSNAQNQGQNRSATHPIPQSQSRTKPATADAIRRNQNQPQPPKLASPFKPQPPEATYQPKAPARQQSREYIAPSAHFNSVSLRPNAPLRDISRTPSIASFNSQHSTSSSLLAKRLGTEKAAQLNLQMKSEEERRAGRTKWKVVGSEDRERAKDPGWRPQLVGKVAAQTPYGGNGGNNVPPGQHSAGMNSGGIYAGNGSESELPMTPGWLPKLTPTRRGDELFLSVA